MAYPGFAKAPNGVEVVLEPMSFEPSKVYQQALKDAHIPWTSFEVDNLDEEYARLKALGVHFSLEPIAAGPARMAVLDDTCGNSIQLVELPR